MRPTAALWQPGGPGLGPHAWAACRRLVLVYPAVILLGERKQAREISLNSERGGESGLADPLSGLVRLSPPTPQSQQRVYPTSRSDLEAPTSMAVTVRASLPRGCLGMSVR